MYFFCTNGLSEEHLSHPKNTKTKTMIKDDTNRKTPG